MGDGPQNGLVHARVFLNVNQTNLDRMTVKAGDRAASITPLVAKRALWIQGTQHLIKRLQDAVAVFLLTGDRFRNHLADGGGQTMTVLTVDMQPGIPQAGVDPIQEW